MILLSDDYTVKHMGLESITHVKIKRMLMSILMSSSQNPSFHSNVVIFQTIRIEHFELMRVSIHYCYANSSSVHQDKQLEAISLQSVA